MTYKLTDIVQFNINSNIYMKKIILIIVNKLDYIYNINYYELLT